MDGDTTSATLLEMAATRAIAYSAGIGERLVAPCAGRFVHPSEHHPPC